MEKRNVIVHMETSLLEDIAKARYFDFMQPLDIVGTGLGFTIMLTSDPGQVYHLHQFFLTYAAGGIIFL